jgi:hypothetical protein
VAERLSDKLPIMMVPADGMFFFANVLRSKSVANQTSKAERVENNRDRFEPYHDGEIPNLATERGKFGAPEPDRPKLVSKPYRVEVLSHGRSGL